MLSAIFFTIVIGFPQVYAATGDISPNGDNSDLVSPDCVNPLGEYGYCFALIECRSLFSILKQKPVNIQSLRFLQKSTCGFEEDRMPKVCCVDDDDIDGWKNKHATNTNPDVAEVEPTEEPPTTTTTVPTTTTTPKPSPVPPVIPTPNDTIISGGKLPVAFSTTEAMTRRFRRHPYFRLLPTTDICGLSITTSDRIIGGRPAELGEFPWMVLLAYDDGEGGEPQFACGGSLISTQYVLTASHCVVNLPEGYKISFVRIGEYDQSHSGEDCLEDLCSDPIQDIEIEEVISHERYDTTKKKENDIALLRLKRPAKLGTFSSPICLPFELDLKYGSLETISKLTVAGWGRTIYDQPDMASVLQTVRIPLISTEGCNDYYTNTVKLSGIDNSRFCAGGEEGVDSCRGDSGGPLMEPLPIPDPKSASSPPIVRTFQFGVVSLGPSRCGSKDQPGLYTKVSNYLIWILDNIRP